MSVMLSVFKVTFSGKQKENCWNLSRWQILNHPFIIKRLSHRWVFLTLLSSPSPPSQTSTPALRDWCRGLTLRLWALTTGARTPHPSLFNYSQRRHRLVVVPTNGWSGAIMFAQFPQVEQFSPPTAICNVHAGFYSTEDVKVLLEGDYLSNNTRFHDSVANHIRKIAAIFCWVGRLTNGRTVKWFRRSL